MRAFIGFDVFVYGKQELVTHAPHSPQHGPVDGCVRWLLSPPLVTESPTHRCFRLCSLSSSLLLPSSTIQARLSILTLRLLGARITPILSSSVTHILHLPSDDSEFTFDALCACMEGSDRTGLAQRVCGACLCGRGGIDESLFCCLSSCCFCLSLPVSVLVFAVRWTHPAPLHPLTHPPVNSSHPNGWINSDSCRRNRSITRPMRRMHICRWRIRRARQPRLRSSRGLPSFPSILAFAARAV